MGKESRPRVAIVTDSGGSKPLLLERVGLNLPGVRGVSQFLISHPVNLACRIKCSTNDRKFSNWLY